MKTEIFAHRGARWCRPENTLASFRQALREKSDGIELDVHLSLDNELIVIHDEKINRTTNGKGFVKDFTLTDLKNFSAGVKFVAQSTTGSFPIVQKIRSLLTKKIFLHEKIPTLLEVLELLSDKNFSGKLNIEIKTDHIHYENIENILSELMTSKVWPFSYIYSSFNFSSLEKIHQLEPQTELAYLTYNKAFEIQRGLDSNFIQAIHPKKTFVLSKNFTPNPKKLRVWTVNSESELKRILAKNVNAIITDFPAKAIKLRDKIQMN